MVGVEREQLLPGGADSKADLVLISMPFGPLFMPSLGLSLLKAAVRPLDISTRVLYFTLPFARLIGSDFYIELANGKPHVHDLAGEWIFARGLFGSDAIDHEGYIDQVLGGRLPAHRQVPPLSEEFIRSVLSVCERVDSFLEECLSQVARYHPAIVGFTSVFQQQLASLALAKRIKAHMPQTFIVLGGANCEGAMGAEVVRQFPFVDAVVSGEGDQVFPELVRRVLEEKPLSGLPGVYAPGEIILPGPDGRYPTAPVVRDMDALPYPDYDDYFEQWRATFSGEQEELAEPETVRLLFETSRGCWWGEKSHCTFCGLNGSTMTYRSKSAARALAELLYLSSRYPGCPIGAVDNILDMKYFKDFIPQLAEQKIGVELFYEVKANLKKEHVRLLRAAGVTLIQPGIESLSSAVLRLMGKGVSGLQNIQLLKWCKELGVEPGWNVLWGFPGEAPEEYRRMAELVPLLTHLPPPVSASTIRLDRFSPHFDHAEAYGFANVMPYPAYAYIYPLPPAVVGNLAYYFTYDYSTEQDVESYTTALAREIETWRNNYETSDLLCIDTGQHALVWDLRLGAQQPLAVLTGLQRTAYLACDEAKTMLQLKQLLQEQTGATLTVQEVERLLQPLLDNGFMLREGNSYLSLAIPYGDYLPEEPVRRRLGELVSDAAEALRGPSITPPVPLQPTATRR